MILITGSSGLIGRAISDRIQQSGGKVRSFDIRDTPDQDIRNGEALQAAMEGVAGIIHLAAVSRVVWAQRDPELAWATNVDALTGLLDSAGRQPHHPWIVFASSREVYGEPEALPVPETAPLRPLNVYARSKVAGEQLIQAAQARGVTAAIARFSNVYGCIEDHADRVVPAFARAAATGGSVRVEGADNMFDFTHIDDVARGLNLLVDATEAGHALPPIHFVSGHGTTLRQLAELAARVSPGQVDGQTHPSRNYDVARFRGDTALAAQLLGWKAAIGIDEGFRLLTDRFIAAGTGLSSTAVSNPQARPATLSA
ncbi:NAD(P)-dependent oxidoreductase [Brevundimonas sp.]|uniref:NAD-dependent epimerase/dehydratase family protein n=1 Tax=Brevundimonas sp. TaxID=1871086 RepID=UPI0024898624|nr:NAD-dependent epimerase/dehydratase family protein [Brevundimonas sp.]MDI1280673.1 NAD-dependent epimerase/dehydratase family protein [Brevundimonas sp.]